MKAKFMFALAILVIGLYRVFSHDEPFLPVAVVCLMSFIILSPLMYDRD